MKKKEMGIDDIFCAMPRLRKYFAEMERKIRVFGEGEGENPAVEKLKKEKEKLLKTAREMDINALRVVYYINNIKELKPYRIVWILQKLNDSLEELISLPQREAGIVEIV